MRRAFSYIAVFLLLSACAASPVSPGLQALQGKNIKTAIEYLGYPDREQTIVGDKVYTWSSRQTFTDMTPVTHYDRGHVQFEGQRGTYETTRTTYVPEINTYSCDIKLVTTPQNIVKDAQVRATAGGCSPYYPAFRDIVRDMGTPEMLEKIGG